MHITIYSEGISFLAVVDNQDRRARFISDIPFPTSTLEVIILDTYWLFAFQLKYSHYCMELDAIFYSKRRRKANVKTVPLGIHVFSIENFSVFHSTCELAKVSKRSKHGRQWHAVLYCWWPRNQLQRLGIGLSSLNTYPKCAARDQLRLFI